MYVFAVIVFIIYFPMHSYPINIFADSVTLTRCCFQANANEINKPFLINIINIFFNMIFVKTYTTNSLKVCMENILISGLKLIDLASKANLIAS